VFTIVANYISGRHNEDIQCKPCCATLNNVLIFILKYVHTCGRDPYSLEHITTCPLTVQRKKDKSKVEGHIMYNAEVFNIDQ